jgi:hypothetical protein
VNPTAPARVLLLVALLLGAATPMSLPAQQREDLYSVPSRARYQPSALSGKRPLTRAERTNFAETSLYGDVVRFIDSLVVLGARIERGSIGRTAEGRELPYVIASRPLVTTPEEARRLGRPVAYIQANIHSGEVEGKEAMLAMLRDLLFDPRPNVLDSIVLIVQPDYNADGNERLADNQRGSQNGPILAGTRQQAQGINLNRDYVGADAPETRASLAMLNRWNPDLFMDLHTTNGSIHGYALTYAPTLSPAAATVAPYLFDRMMPEIRRRVRERQGFEMNDYGDFSRARGAGAGPAGGAALGGGRGGVSLEAMIADSIPASGWTFSTYSHLPRYGTNYYGLRSRLSILSEAFSHDPFPRRVASTYAFVGESLSYLAEHAEEVIALGRDADARVAGWAGRPGSSPPLALRARMDTTRIEDVRVEVVLPLADTTRREMGMGNRERTGVVKPVRMPVMASFEPTLTRTLPFAYAFGAQAADSLLPILRVHGVQVQQLTAAASVDIEPFAVDSVVDRGRNETPRNLKEVRGSWNARTTRTLPVGTYVVPAGQPYGLLVFYLLEPESDDGLAPFMDGVLAGGREFPVVRIVEAATLSARAVP